MEPGKRVSGPGNGQGVQSSRSRWPATGGKSDPHLCPPHDAGAFRRFPHCSRLGGRAVRRSLDREQSTVLNRKDYGFGTGLALGDFARTALKRER